MILCKRLTGPCKNCRQIVLLKTHVILNGGQSP